MKLHRALFWCEVAIAASLAAFGVDSLREGISSGDQDYHGGAYLILLGIFLLAGALAFSIGALGLRGQKEPRIGWWAQVFPAAVVAWVLWDVLSHPAAWHR